MNALRTETELINGRKVDVTVLPATVGARLMIRIVKLMGFALAGGSVDGIAQQLVARSSTAFDPEDVLRLILDLLVQTRLDGKELTREVFDMEFAGEYGFLIKVLAFTIKANRFFDLRGILPPDMEARLKQAMVEK